MSAPAARAAGSRRRLLLMGAAAAAAAAGAAALRAPRRVKTALLPDHVDLGKIAPLGEGFFIVDGWVLTGEEVTSLGGELPQSEAALP